MLVINKDGYPVIAVLSMRIVVRRIHTEVINQEGTNVTYMNVKDEVYSLDMYS